MDHIPSFSTKIFADGAHFDDIVQMAQFPHIKGFTTNPTLMRKAGITDYEAFGRKVLSAVPDHPVSLEVFADAPDEMEAQARYIATWGPNVNIKIPITNTQGEFMGPLIQRLAEDGIVLNITAIMTLEHVKALTKVLNPNVPSIISVFAGRIADTGVDPIPHMKEALQLLREAPLAELLWASPREVLNIFQADQMGCHIITVTPDLLKKLSLFQKDLGIYSKETVEMFYRDACAAGYTIATDAMAEV